MLQRVALHLQFHTCVPSSDDNSETKCYRDGIHSRFHIPVPSSQIPHSRETPLEFGIPVERVLECGILGNGKFTYNRHELYIHGKTQPRYDDLESLSHTVSTRYTVHVAVTCYSSPVELYSKQCCCTNNNKSQICKCILGICDDPILSKQQKSNLLPCNLRNVMVPCQDAECYIVHQSTLYQTYCTNTTSPFTSLHTPLVCNEVLWICMAAVVCDINRCAS